MIHWLQAAGHRLQVKVIIPFIEGCRAEGVAWWILKDKTDAGASSISFPR